ncbi:putative protein OS=Castellaniella defragrans (strain DSM / CCUG 39792 / 65Phen) OX=1437824 GN=BN940_09116 PE=4 SV=1 [Castellaniella denitrificans]
MVRSSTGEPARACGPSREGRFSPNSRGPYGWLHRGTAWLYVDALGVVRGRVDRMEGGPGAPWYWWQTAEVTSGTQDLMMARWLVEQMIEGA